ncbi:MAG: O-antigen ligase family protein [Gallionellaceae bacterium]|jgi:O-antigen ligase|nr:O-antigen ligase family protein [Gallionellaceae bacterium]
MTYLAAGLMLAALLVSGDLRTRVTRLRASPVFWPLAVYAVWTLVVLALEPHYPQTPDNLWHGLRITMTIGMAMMLTRAEVVGALRGFCVAAVVGVLLIVLERTVGLPDLSVWRSIVHMTSNKSIANALLFAIFGTSAAVLGLAHLSERRRWGWIGLAFVITALSVLVVTFVLPSRTSLIGIVLALCAACIHQWRARWGVLAVALLVMFVALAIGVWQAQPMRQKFELGMHELAQAKAGTISEGSWVVRYHMYRDTTRMMLDRPLMGWGIGAWNTLWQERGPALLRNYNMPHDDFLWMGAQAGIPGFLALLAILLTSIWVCWRRPDVMGRLGLVAPLILLIATSVHSAMRDAQIGLALPWIAFVYLRLVQEPGSSWREVLPISLVRARNNSQLGPQE